MQQFFKSSVIVGRLVLFMATSGLFGQQPPVEFSLDDFPTAPLMGPPVPPFGSAEDEFGLCFSTARRLCSESYYLHWYQVGKAWSRWTRSKTSLARIS